MKNVRLHTVIIMLVLSIIVTSSQLEAQTRSIQVTVRTSTGKTLDLYTASYALVVGNGNYTKGWDPLPGAIRDVREVADVLRKNGFKVTLKTDLTKDAFSRALGEFVLEHGSYENNRLLFCYAGHGHTRPMATGEHLGYLVMVNAPTPEKDPLGFSLSSVDMQALVTQAKMIKAKHVLFLFDSCFSGTVLNLRERTTPKTISDNIRHPVRQFITAGRANEPVPDHSVFKQAFLDLLEGRAQEPIPDGYVTGEELGLYLKNTVPEYNPAQHPQYGKIRDPKLDKGDFVFVKMGPSAIERSKAEETKAKVDELQKRMKEFSNWLYLGDLTEAEITEAEEEIAAKASVPKEDVILRVPTPWFRDVGIRVEKEGDYYSLDESSLITRLLKEAQWDYLNVMVLCPEAHRKAVAGVDLSFLESYEG